MILVQICIDDKPMLGFFTTQIAYLTKILLFFSGQGLDPDLPVVRDLVPSPHNSAVPGLVPNLPGGDIILALAVGPPLQGKEGRKIFSFFLFMKHNAQNISHKT